MKVKSEELTLVSEQPDQVLKVWDVESSHKYENNQHTSQVINTHLTGENTLIAQVKIHTSQVKIHNSQVKIHSLHR